MECSEVKCLLLMPFTRPFDCQCGYMNVTHLLSIRADRKSRTGLAMVDCVLLLSCISLERLFL